MRLFTFGIVLGIACLSGQGQKPEGPHKKPASLADYGLTRFADDIPIRMTLGCTSQVPGRTFAFGEPE
jgi:hypothetical protein